MSTPNDWLREYARQADADIRAWDALRVEAQVPRCHELMFLQMACDTLCKAYLIKTGTAPESLQASHSYIANPLPIVIREQMVLSKRSPREVAWLLEYVRHLAREIEMLAPAVKRGGKRPDNCEYPWEDATGEIHSPLDWTFAP